MNTHPRSTLHTATLHTATLHTATLHTKSKATATNSYRLAVLIPLLIAVIHPSLLQAQSCNGQIPAFAIPENLWFTGVFRPGETDLPGNQIPAKRDSTSWDSLTIPGYGSGHEIFESLDIAGNYLHVAYNAGFSVWNIAGSANGEDPIRIQVRDGWYTFACQQDPICGPFLSFPEAGEIDFLVEDISVLAQGTTHYIALSGRSPVGTSLWRFNTATNTVTPIYQDTTRVSRQVRLVAVDDTIYALTSSDGGLDVYDLSRALVIDPCLEETGSDCPGVYRGNVGTSSNGRYLDILQRPSGELLIANSNGDVSGLGLELWKLPDPASPSVATRLFSGLDNRTFGTAMFSYEGNDYLAALERDGSFNMIKIFNINACSGSCSLGASVFSLGVPPRISNQFLTFSTSNGTPFLYYGLFGGFGGPKVEQLLNLTTLGRSGQNITEMTTGSPTYFDACEQDDLDYWPWYYPGNEFGLKNLSPRIGKFDSDSSFFYRAAGGVLDVHVWGDVQNATITTTVSNPDPQGLYWMGDEITFEGQGGDGCNPVGIWTWTPTTPPTVDAVTVSESGNQITYRFECNTAGRCDDALVSVSGENNATSCADATPTPATITVKDPTLEIVSITPAGGTFTQCTVVTFEAELLGRGPTSFAWSVNSVEERTGVVPEEDLSTSMLSFDWDTAEVSFGEIFSDGFESGDLSAWVGIGIPELPKRGAVGGFSRRGTKGTLRGGTLPVTIELALDGGNPSDSVDVDLSPVTGDPELGDPPITSSTTDNATFDFHANSVVGTVSEWNWELEDDDGGSLCTFGVDTGVPCVLKTGQDISHTWVLQTGNRRVDLTVSNCQTTTTAQASTTVAVASLEPLEVTSFELDRAQSNGDACDVDFDCITMLVCTCYTGETVFFEVQATGDPDFYDFDWDGNGTFEDASNPVTGTEYTKIYPTAIGQIVPQVRARRGTADPVEKDLRETLDIQP